MSNNNTLKTTIQNAVAPLASASNPDLRNGNGLPPKDAFLAAAKNVLLSVLGFVVSFTNNFAAFALSTYSRFILRQGSNPFQAEAFTSVSANTEIFCFSAWTDLLSTRFVVTKKKFEPSESFLKAAAKAQNYGFTERATTEMAECITASSNVVVFVPQTWSALVCKFSDNENNVKVLPDAWGGFVDFNVGMTDAAWVAKTFAAAVSQPSVKFAKVSNEHFTLTLDGSQTFHITPKGVKEGLRGQVFGNTVLDYGHTVGYGEERNVDQLVRISSHGSFIYALLVLGATAWNEPSKLFRVMTKGDYIPMSNLEEIAHNEPGRERYDAYATTVVAATGFPFFQVRNLNGNVTVTSRKKDIYFSKAKSLGRLTAVAMFEKYGMLQMPKGTYVDGREAFIDFRNLPREAKDTAVKAIFDRAGVDPLTFVNAEFHAEYTTEAEALAFLATCGLLLSNKKNKAIKRCLMSLAVTGQMANEESACFVQFHEHKTYGESKGVAVPSVISYSIPHAAGNAAYVGDDMDALLEMLVPHTQLWNSPAEMVGNLSNVQLMKAADNVETVGNWVVHQYTRQLPIKSGECVALVPYETSAGQAMLTVNNDQADAFLKEVRLCVSTTNGNTSVVSVKIVTETRVSELKGRNNIKAIITKAAAELIYNGLPGAADLVAKLVLFRDTNKSTDLLVKLIDVAALTFIKNNDATGLSLIKEANEYVNYYGIDKLVYSALGAACGIYDPLMDYFYGKFGRAVWVKYQDTDNAEMRFIFKEMYADWSEVSVDGVFPEGATNCLLLTDDKTQFETEVASADVDKTSNLIGFYDLNGEKFTLLRGWCFAGTQETGPVWQLVKGEMSSVDATVGSTPTMAGFGRSVFKKNKTAGRNILLGNLSRVHLQGAFLEMLDGKAIGNTRLVTLGEAVSLISSETKALMAQPSEYSGLLEKIAFDLREVTVALGDVSVYVPAIWKQDANRGFASQGGLSNNVQFLFVGACTGVDLPALGLGRRIKGALQTVASGKSLSRAGAYGSLSFQSKVSAPCLPIPVGEMWIKKSLSGRSVYQNMKRLFGDIDGKTLAVGRAPMVEALFVKAVVIDVDHWAYDFVPEFTMSISVFAMTVNGGDFDGDNIYASVVEGINVTTLDEILEMLIVRTGSNQLTPGASYIGDHFEFPSYKKQMKKMGANKASVLSHLATTGKADAKQSWGRGYGLNYLSVASAESLQEHVGKVHSLFLNTEVTASLFTQIEGTAFATLLSEDEDASSNLSWCNSLSISAVMAEMYEIPLGGLDWDAYDLFRLVILPTLAGKAVPSGDEFEKALAAAGLNANCATDVRAATLYARHQAEILEANTDSDLRDPELISSTEDFVATKGNQEALKASGVFNAIVALSVMIAKGRALNHLAIVDSLKLWIDDNQEMWTELQSVSPTVAVLAQWMNAVAGYADFQSGKPSTVRFVSETRFTPKA